MTVTQISKDCFKTIIFQTLSFGVFFFSCQTHFCCYMLIPCTSIIILFFSSFCSITICYFLLLVVVLLDCFGLFFSIGNNLSTSEIGIRSVYTLSSPYFVGLRWVCCYCSSSLTLWHYTEEFYHPHFDSIMLLRNSYDSPADGKSSFR